MSPRTRAFLVHLALSAIVILALIAYVRWVWYPGGLFWVEGVTDPLSVLFGVDVVIGPLLTLLLFVPGKRGLKLDMTLIIVLQLAALGYGAHVLWSARPVAVAFNGDAFEVARAYEMPDTRLPDWAEPLTPVGGPAMVFADQSDDPEFVLRVLLQGQPDVHLLPEHYQPLADRLERLTERAYDMQALLEFEPFRGAWWSMLGALPETAEDVIVVPLYGRIRDGAVVLDAGTGQVKAIVDVDITGVPGASPRLRDQKPEAGEQADNERGQNKSSQPAPEDAGEPAAPARDADIVSG